MKKVVIVAMSGGVDSSVAASLLKKNGYEVRGVFLDFWKDDCSLEENKCCNSDSKKRAKKVAKILNIPFHVFDFKKEFKSYVVDYFIKQYECGFTPNPCIECNKKIKFGFLFDKIKALNCEYLATGHYVKVLKTKNAYSIYKAKDNKKDQSYFLYNLNQKKLKSLLFPLGDYTKEEVRKLAKEFGLPTAKTKESQDVCFVENNNLEKFLKKYINIKPGLILNAEGKKIGKHNGLPFYTIGQRKGIKIGGGKPYYVTKIDIKNNILIVTNSPKDKNLLTSKFKVQNVSWVSKRCVDKINEVDVLVRYRQSPVKALIEKCDRRNNTCFINLKKPQKAVTPGQSAVFYKGNKLLGGGTIER